jgi:glycosyltransferase involved in cell wall biosynthesis
VAEDLPSSAGSMRLLFMTPYPLALDAPHGGRVTAGLVLKLAQRHPVALVCLRGRDEPGTDDAIRQACRVVEEVKRPEQPQAPRWRSRLVQLRKLIGSPPALVAQARAPDYADRLRAVEAFFRPTVVQVEPHEMAQYLRYLRGTAKCVLVDQDPGQKAATDYSREATGLRRMWRRLDEIAWRRYSRRTASGVDAVVVFNQRDQGSVESYASSKPIVVIPFQVAPPEEPLETGEDSSRILFFGGYRHPPNADAAERLALAILPCVRRRHPSAELELVGEPTEQVKTLAGDSVVITGRVEAVSPHLAAAAVVAVPIRMGGGMRVKVLESLAAGKAVVASSRAMEGLDVTPGREFVLAETDQEFCDAICDLLERPDLRLELGTAARRRALATYDPDSAVEAFEALYRRLLAA